MKLQQRAELSNNSLFALVQMKEGSAEAGNILQRLRTELPRDNDWVFAMLDLDDMNIRGEQIVTAFKHCGEDIQRFNTALHQRNPAMVEAVNAEGRTKSWIHKAVTRGGSTRREYL